MIRYLEKNRAISFFLLILVAIEIFYFSSIPSFPKAPVKGINFSIIYHISAFFLFSFFLLSLLKGAKKIKLKHILLSLIISLIYSISDEFHQSFVPGRDCSLKDVLFDLIGILLAILVYPKTQKTKKEKEA